MSNPWWQRQSPVVRRLARHPFLVAVACLLALCLATNATARTDPGATRNPVQYSQPGRQNKPVVVILAIDGVRWQEVFEGADPSRLTKTEGSSRRQRQLMPELQRLLATRGAILGAPRRGPPPRASGPNFVSLPGYSEMLSGRAPSDCRDNGCARAREPTLLDQVARTGPPGDVAVFCSWPNIARIAAKDPARFPMSCGRTKGRQLSLIKQYPSARRWFERGQNAKPKPGFGEFRPDRYTAGLALAYLEARRPSLTFISLGETDEYAHQNRYADYLDALRFADGVIGRLWLLLHRFESEGSPVSLFVTTDHGRGPDFVHHGRDFPDSARVWLAAIGSAVHARGRMISERQYRLASLVPTVQDLLDLPPRVPGQTTRAFEEFSVPSGLPGLGPLGLPH